jgi:hypothetical protein
MAKGVPRLITGELSRARAQSVYVFGSKTFFGTKICMLQHSLNTGGNANFFSPGIGKVKECIIIGCRFLSCSTIPSFGAITLVYINPVAAGDALHPALLGRGSYCRATSQEDVMEFSFLVET